MKTSNQFEADAYAIKYGLKVKIVISYETGKLYFEVK